MSSKDTIGKTFKVAGLLCLICSVLVSILAVSLKPIQQKNRDLDRKKNILAAAGLYKGMSSIDAVFSANIKPRVVELATGNYVTDIDANTFDAVAAAKDPNKSVAIAKSKDIAGISRRAQHAVVYEVVIENELKMVILPVYGKGLWSTLYGFLAVKSDVNTIQGLGFYEHGETPGLGGEVDNPKWKSLWHDKKLFDDRGDLKVEVMKGQVNPNSPAAIHQVDGLSGATITSRGVSFLVKYWLGPDAFGKFLTKLKSRRMSNG